MSVQLLHSAHTTAGADEKIGVGPWLQVGLTAGMEHGPRCCARGRSLWFVPPREIVGRARTSRPLALAIQGHGGVRALGSLWAAWECRERCVALVCVRVRPRPRGQLLPPRMFSLADFCIGQGFLG